ncbi:MAG: exonuclease domain-containing protein [Clostridiales bacterium]|nr:exonuclease domain-containing protein [Clostridiales bacterium]
MQYIIMDLEWNTAFSKQYDRYINEIIEIGAVKLDENRKVVSTFSSFVRPQIEKKLRSRVKNLTNITNDDVKAGEDFLTVIGDFSEWANSDDVIFLSWGNMDIRVMVDNFKYFNGQSKIPFINYYVDLQDYSMEMLKLSKSQQLGLNNAADILNINLDYLVLHRALTDSEISAKCFEKLYQKEEFEKKIKKCDDRFYEKLFFKPYIISDINDPLVDKSVMNCKCTDCGNIAKRLDNWKFINGSFRAFFVCKNCNIKMRANIQFKKYYERVNIRKSIIKMERKPANPND